MKKIILIAFLFIFTLGASTAFAASSDPENSAADSLAVPVNTENNLSEEEMSLLANRVEEIRDMDKTNMTTTEKRELKKELKEIKENVKRSGGVVYISAGTILLIILIILLI